MYLYQDERYLAEKPQITAPKMTTATFSVLFESKFGKLNKVLDAKRILDYLREDVSFVKDCKIDVGLEHFGVYTSYCNICKNLVGATGVMSGDTDYGVFFILYFDGKRFRMYIPTAGNFFNIVAMTSFGRENDSLVKGRLWSGTRVDDYNLEAGKHLYLKDYAIEQEGKIVLNDDNCVHYGAHDMTWIQRDIGAMFDLV